MLNTLNHAAEPLVSLESVGVHRNGRWLVRGVDFTVRRGEIVTLIGPNGSGKSTCAKAAIGVLKPDEGRVSRIPDLKVGYVPQKLAIDWTLPLTVRRLMTLTGPLAQRDVDAALAAVGMSALAGAEVQHLSGGEFQRALLARAIARKPHLLVLDEPVQGVDFSGELALYDLIKQIRNATGCGILLISHDLHVVMAETDTVICLNGHVCCRGTPQAVSQSPEYMRLFGARAAQTIALYSHHHDHTHLPDGRVQHADGSITDHCHAEDGHHDHRHGVLHGVGEERPHVHGPDCGHLHQQERGHGHGHGLPVAEETTGLPNLKGGEDRA
ncbi:ATP-binding cassette domain-containing protein [Rhizobiaceae bacterium n13]|uniref:ATP-binding cassette domain-containing protein n=1 Tax=Ferirhizobium litorale TaxID=2927786 RepID=UPI0024B2E3BA|nr:ATP-binding cassette domain-containing protein [Fererhizobium litorale]MDI7863531.1 ATP-binding cassette domain-containing protein [Fererhizobium litorale]